MHRIAAPIAVSVVFFLLSLAGCVRGPSEPGKGWGEDLDDLQFVTGIVVDSEFFPVADAAVSLDTADHENVTALDGTFTLGPVAPGKYTLTAERTGYADSMTPITVGNVDTSHVQVILEPVALDVPFHETTSYVGYVFCFFHIFIVGLAPCLPINDFVGGNVTPDRRFYDFSVPNHGLQSLLYEMRWESQATCRDMGTGLNEGGQSVNTIAKRYGGGSGPSPLRLWFDVGIENPGANTEFTGERGETYRALWGGRYNSTNNEVACVQIDARVENFFTFFYNRAGARDFTVLPDE